MPFSANQGVIAVVLKDFWEGGDVVAIFSLVVERVEMVRVYTWEILHGQERSIVLDHDPFVHSWYPRQRCGCPFHWGAWLSSDCRRWQCDLIEWILATEYLYVSTRVHTYNHWTAHHYEPIRPGWEFGSRCQSILYHCILGLVIVSSFL